MASEQLRVTDGIERGKLLTVEADLVIGRYAVKDEGRLGGDSEISRRHARFSRGADRQLSIEDLGSSNGTFVNDEPIDVPRRLEVGDVIKVGKTVLQVTDGSGVVPEKSRPPSRVPADEAPSLSASVEAGEVLVVTVGSAMGRRLAISDELVIGRGVTGEGRLRDDVKLSRRHVRVAREASGQLIVEDLGSANGTFVNGERVNGSRVLNAGDSLRVGSTTMQLSDAGRAPPAPATASSEPTSARSAPAPAQGAPAPAQGAPAPARSAPAPAGPAADRARLALELPPGSVFAGCRVEEVISQGDMSVLYRAQELALQRRVAIKLIHPEYSRDERFRERFRRESRIAAAIDHANVIPIFDAGDEDGVLYIMMRLVEGTDMGAMIASEGALEPIRAARIVRQVGAALDAAHARGMVHRDVKPSNVLVARSDHVYLSDFGLANNAASADRLTRHGTVVARVEYLAPEQLLDQRVDARADIYALGCLLFEALTGEPPFARWTDVAQALAAHDARQPSPLDLRPDLPQEFGDVVRRAMANDPSQRYPSAGDLGQAALVAAGGLRRASRWSIVATGEAAPPQGGQIEEPLAAAAPQAPVPEVARAGRPPVQAGGQAGRPDMLRWAIALAALAIVAVGMVAALRGISTL